MNAETRSHEDKLGFQLLITDGKSSHPRDPMPKLLADAGVPERLWHVTFDETKYRSEAYASATRNLDQSFTTSPCFSASVRWLLVMVIFMPIYAVADLGNAGAAMVLSFILFIFWVNIGMSEKQAAKETRVAQIRAWPKFIQEVRFRLQHYGIFVSELKVPKRLATYKLAAVGAIRFSAMEDDLITPCMDVEGALSDEPGAYLPVATCPAIEAIESDIPETRNGRSMVEDLEALEKLRERGVLTETEFQRAKAKLLRDCGVWGSTVPALAIAEVIPVDDIDHNDHSEELNTSEGEDPLTRLL